MQFKNLLLAANKSMQLLNTTHKHTNIQTDYKNEQKEQTQTPMDAFEGCEKRLILLFNGTGDLRSITKLEWIKILKHARCAILNTIQNTQCIAHLLSESSLFIFKHKLMIKTCGNTTLLLILPIIIQKCNQINLMIHNIFYSRSNFMFPANQPMLHRSFDHEIQYLNQYFRGHAIVLGSLKKARWHCYNNNNNYYKLSARKHNNKTLEIVLFDLNNECMEYYFQDFMHKNGYKKHDLDKRVIDGCCIPKKAMIDTYLFEPCGYSLNGILNDNYWTIHITPEKDASFVSFETDYSYNDYAYVIQNVIDVFKPNRFSFAINSYDDSCDEKNNVGIDNCVFNGFDLCDYATHKLSTYHNIKWCNYNRCGGVDNEISEREKTIDNLDITADSDSLWKYIQSNVIYYNRKYSKSTSHLLSLTHTNYGMDYDHDHDRVNEDNAALFCMSASNTSN